MATRKWIVIEGLDGVGKTSIVKDLAQRMENSFITPKPPSQVLDFINQQHLFLRRQLYFCLNLESKQRAIEAMNNGQNVVSDRYLASTLAYMRAFDDYRNELLESEFIKETLKDRKPDLTVLLTAAAEQRIKRLKMRDGDNVTKEEVKLMSAENEKKCMDEFLNSGYIDLLIDTTNKTVQEITDQIIKSL